MVNSLLVKTSSTQVYTESMPAPATSRGKMTLMVMARSIHRAKELAVELQGWSSSSLREVLLTCGVWEEGMRPLAPDKPRIVMVWGDPWENGSLPLGTNQLLCSFLPRLLVATNLLFMLLVIMLARVQPTREPSSPSHVISFMHAVANTSGHLYSELVLLLFWQTHRETDRQLKY